MPRTNKKYSPEFKIQVIEDKLQNNLTFSETAIKYKLYTNIKGYEYPDKGKIHDWERIYLEKGKEGFYVENRGRGSIGKGNTSIRKPLDPKIEEDLIAKCQRLEMENEYLKKLSALISARERNEKKSPK